MYAINLVNFVGVECINWLFYVRFVPQLSPYNDNVLMRGNVEIQNVNKSPGFTLAACLEIIKYSWMPIS